MSVPRCSECGAITAPHMDNAYPGPCPVAEKAFDLNVAPGTQHHKLVTTNEPPALLDLVHVESIIAKIDAHLTGLDDQISQMRDHLKQLEEECVSLLRYREQNVAICSPLRRMPPEVLAEIFSWTLPSVSEARRQTRLDIAHSPWVLTHVNSRWRAVALSTPSLWSLIVIDWNERSVFPLSLVKLQIERAWTLKIHFYGNSRILTRPQTDTFVLLSEFSSRWEDLLLQLTSDLIPLLPTLRDRLQSLRRLWMQWDDSRSQAGVDSIDCFQAAPSLVDADVWNRFRFVPTLLPSHQLTRYHLDGPWTIHQNILKVAQRLVEARIDITFNNEPWPESPHIIDLICLRRLYVSKPEVLDYLRAPALQEIALFDRENDCYIRYLEPLLARSSCILRRLCLEGCPTALKTTEVLQRIPSITTLLMLPSARCKITDIVSMLTVPQSTGRTVVAPQLRSLRFGYQKDCYPDYAAYFEMVKSRWEAEECALTAATLLVPWGPGPDGALRSGLDALRMDGLDFELLRGQEALEAMRHWLHYPSWS